MRPARLDGTWALSGWELGKGADLRPRHDHRESVVHRTSSRPGDVSRRAHRRNGHAHRPGALSTPASSGAAARRRRRADSAMREVMMVDRDWRTIEGRWFTGGYDELGLDVKLERVGSETRVLGTDRTALRAGRGRAGAQDLRRQPRRAAAPPMSISAPALPSPASSARRRMSPRSPSTSRHRRAGRARSVRRRRVAAESARGLRQHRRHQGEARLGDGARRRRHVPEDAGAVRGVGATATAPTASRIRRTTSSSASSTRRGAWKNTPRPTTTTTSSSSGRLNEATGRFTPNVDGPNPARSGQRNNIGDVWVVAKCSATPPAASRRATLRARAHLLVTVPLYMRFDPTAGPQ